MRRLRLRPQWLREDEEERILTETVADLRQHAIYQLALGAGLLCREIAALDVRDVSDDGAIVRETAVIRSHDGRRRPLGATRSVPLDSGVVSAVQQHLTCKRTRCPHFERPMRTMTGRDRIARCAVCGDFADAMKSPLFASRLQKRVSAKWLREEFARVRDELRLRPSLHFDLMAATFATARKDTK